MSLGDQLEALAPAWMTSPITGRTRVRKCVLATNVAETSLTIPGIAFVVDCGFVRAPSYDPATQRAALLTRAISRAQAVQRSGRAGRVRAGKCFRLYTAETFASLAPASPPQMLCEDLTPVALAITALRSTPIARFPFVDPPPSVAVVRALDTLFALGAVDSAGAISAKGRDMIQLGAPPFTASMLLAAAEPRLGCAEEAVSLAAMCAVEGSGALSAFGKAPSWGASAAGATVVPVRAAVRGAIREGGSFRKPGSEGGRESDDSGGTTLWWQRYAAIEGDHLTLLNVFSAYKASSFSDSWCQECGLQPALMRRARELRDQLHRALSTVVAASHGALVLRSCASEADAASRIMQAVLAGYFGNVAQLARDGSYRTLRGDRAIQVPDWSALTYARANAAGSLPVPAWVVFHESVLVNGREIARDVSAIDPRWALDAAPQVLELHETDPARREVEQVRERAKEQIPKGIAASAGKDPAKDEAAEMANAMVEQQVLAIFGSEASRDEATNGSVSSKRPRMTNPSEAPEKDDDDHDDDDDGEIRRSVLRGVRPVARRSMSSRPVTTDSAATFERGASSVVAMAGRFGGRADWRRRAEELGRHKSARE